MLLPAQYWDPCHTEFPNVVYLDHRGLCGRTLVTMSTHKFWWSKPGVNPTNQDYVPVPNAEATYFINIANCKSHEGGGISMCGKCYYGALFRTPSTAGYYELHGDLPWSSGTPGWGHYRTLTDFMAHGDFGGKGMLWMLDALWGGTDAGTRPTKWNMAPFNGTWPSSLVVSMDQVAIDSVGLDAVTAEGEPYVNPTNPKYVAAADDYLHEAATIDSPPSGIFYDSDHSGLRRSSLGTHEHWNNNTARQYSRNLSPTGAGIELRWFDLGDPGDANRDKTVNALDLTAVINAYGESWDQPGFDPKADLNCNGRVDASDVLEVLNNFGKVYP